MRSIGKFIGSQVARLDALIMGRPTIEMVDDRIAAVVDGAPDTADTLRKLYYRINETTGLLIVQDTSQLPLIQVERLGSLVFVQNGDGGRPTLYFATSVSPNATFQRVTGEGLDGIGLDELLDRSNHHGFQPLSSIVNLEDRLASLSMVDDSAEIRFAQLERQLTELAALLSSNESDDDSLAAGLAAAQVAIAGALERLSQAELAVLRIDVVESAARALEARVGQTESSSAAILNSLISVSSRLDTLETEASKIGGIAARLDQNESNDAALSAQLATVLSVVDGHAARLDQDDIEIGLLGDRVTALEERSTADDVGDAVTDAKLEELRTLAASIETRLAGASAMYAVDSVDEIASLPLEVGDYLIRSDEGEVLRLGSDGWKVVLASAPKTLTRTFSFPSEITVPYVHNLGRFPTSVTIIDGDGRLQYADWTADLNSITLNFTERTSGTCSLVFGG